MQQASKYFSPLYAAVWASFVKTVPKIEPKYSLKSNQILNRIGKVKIFNPWKSIIVIDIKNKYKNISVCFKHVFAFAQNMIYFDFANYTLKFFL